MLFDKRIHTIRQFAVRRIQTARKDLNTGDVRKFEIPKVNFMSKDYIDLIQWKYTFVTEPPLTRKRTDAELKDLMEKDKYPPSCDI
jgi:hypothetical protein